MDFDFTEEQEMFRNTVREFVKKELPIEYVKRCESEGRPPWEAFQKIAELGWLGVIVPEEYGGSGGSAIDLMILMEELGRGMLELALMVFRTAVHCVSNIRWHGTQKQKEYFLPKAVKGELIFSFALTEPHAGSDAAAITTSAVADGDDYIINGSKMFCTGLHIANWCLVATRTDKTVPKHKGITNFLVDPKNPGIEIRLLETLGRRCVPTCEATFDGVRVPKDNMLARLNESWKNILSHLELERLVSIASFVGAAQAAFDDALQYAKVREQFGQPIGKFQAISHKLADMQVAIHICRLLMYNVAWLVTKGQRATMETAIYKLYCGEAYKYIALEGMQIMGAYGYTTEYNMERHLRESLVATMGPGSSETQRNIISRELGL